MTPSTTHPAPRRARSLSARAAALLALLAGLAAPAAPARADERSSDPGGEVRVPLSVYTALVHQGEGGPQRTTPRHALGQASMQVEVADGPQATAAVRIELQVTVLGEGPALIPLLPAGSPVSAVVDGSPAALVATPDGLAWSADGPGRHQISLSFPVDAVRSPGGFTLTVPAPRAPALELQASLPGNVDAAVVPATAMRAVPGGDRTRITATCPATAAVQITWRMPSGEGHAFGRALYKGELQGESMAFVATFAVDLASAGPITLPLFPRSVTLAEARVDGKPAAVRVVDEHFAVTLAGRGAHEVSVAFQVAVVREDGPPRVDLELPEVPVSRFELALPGRKELRVTPATAVQHTVSGTRTLATVFAPMGDALSFSWIEAVPEETRAELVANATLIHAVRAEEGVLQARALVEVEITRGETSLIDLDLPADVQVTKVTAAAGGIADWRVRTVPGKASHLDVYLDHKAHEAVSFEVTYEKLLPPGAASAAHAVPLLGASSMRRQRGMVALLAGPELALAPVAEPRAARVGENQLPAEFRHAIAETVAHTYRYSDAPPTLSARLVAPEKKPVTFDSQVDTLVSVGEASLKGSATIEIDVKTGSLMAAELVLPEGLNVLSLAGPSLRGHKVRAEDGRQVLAVDFTEEMEGQFQLELLYERILPEAQGEVAVPLPSVRAAAVERGRVAVEALAAVEVTASAAEALTPVEAAELPRQLILRTQNPILLAYRYARAEPAPRLALKVARHRSIEVQSAAIAEAAYRTLITADGLAVTAATLSVRNIGRQFLALSLPPGSEVWSVSVAGRPEKPAAAEGKAGAPGDSGKDRVLIRLVRAADVFPIEIVYATPIGRPGAFGTIAAQLPRPEMLVAHTRWDVYLPEGLVYRRPWSNLDPVEDAMPVGRDVMEAAVGGALARAAGGAGDAGQVPTMTLPIAVPARGVHLAFEKLYADRSPEAPAFRIAYVTRGAERAAAAVAVVSALLLLAGAAMRLGLVGGGPSSRAAQGAIACALAGLAVTVGWIGTSPWPAVGVLLAGSAVAAVHQARLRLRPAPVPGEAL